MKQTLRFIGLALLGVIVNACGQSEGAEGQTSPAFEAASARPDAGGAAEREGARDGKLRPSSAGPSPCGAEELDPIEACIGAACPGLSGPEFASCAMSSCQTEIFDASSVCLSCLADHPEGPLEELVEICGSGPIEPNVCTAEEVVPLEACVSANCQGLAGTDLTICALNLCTAEVNEISDPCQTCLSQNANLGVDGVFDACVPDPPPPPPEPACAAEEFDPIEACVFLECGKLRGSPLISCAQQRCAGTLGGASSACVDCMLQNAGGGIFGVAEACGGLGRATPAPPRPRAGAAPAAQRAAGKPNTVPRIDASICSRERVPRSSTS